MPRDQVFVELDFSNAFNTLRRDVMLQAVYNTIPELYAFIHQAYSAESLLQFGPFVVHSTIGAAARGPSGPVAVLSAAAFDPTINAFQIKAGLSG